MITEFENAIDVLIEQLKINQKYKELWQSMLFSAYMAESKTYLDCKTIANNAAQRFLKTLITSNDVPSKLNKTQTTFLDNHVKGSWIENSDGTVDVYGSFSIRNENFYLLPVKLRNVTGDCDLAYNNLTSFNNCPIYVGGNFYADHNFITSLQDMPKEIKKNCDVSYNKKLFTEKEVLIKSDVFLTIAC